MRDDWHATQILARQTQLQIWRALVEQAAGTGLGPTAAEIEQANALQCSADLKHAAMDRFLREILD